MLEYVRERFRKLVAEALKEAEPQKRIVCGLGDVRDFVEMLKLTIRAGRVEDCRAKVLDMENSSLLSKARTCGDSMLLLPPAEVPKITRIPWPEKPEETPLPVQDEVEDGVSTSSAPIVQGEPTPGVSAVTRSVPDLLVRPGSGSGLLKSLNPSEISSGRSGVLPGCRFTGIHECYEPVILESLEEGWSTDDPRLPEKQLVRSAPSRNLEAFHSACA